MTIAECGECGGLLFPFCLACGSTRIIRKGAYTRCLKEGCETACPCIAGIFPNDVDEDTQWLLYTGEDASTGDPGDYVEAKVSVGQKKDPEVLVRIRLEGLVPKEESQPKRARKRKA